jgi:hypothetical protein
VRVAWSHGPPATAHMAFHAQSLPGGAWPRGVRGTHGHRHQGISPCPPDSMPGHQPQRSQWGYSDLTERRTSEVVASRRRGRPCQADDAPACEASQGPDCGRSIPRQASGSPMRRAWRTNAGRPRRPRTRTTTSIARTASMTIPKSAVATGGLTESTTKTKPSHVKGERRSRRHAARGGRPCSLRLALTSRVRPTWNANMTQPTTASPTHGSSHDLTRARPLWSCGRAVSSRSAPLPSATALGHAPGSTCGCRRSSPAPDVRRSGPLLAAARRCRHDRR